MFYADEIVYIFEAETADLIKIPRLPIKIDTQIIQDRAVEFTLMAAGKLYSVEALADVPESLLEIDGQDATLSDWGLLVWNRTKAELLKDKLLDFPMLHYAPSFLHDFKDRNANDRVSLQEKLAKVSTMLEENNGDTSKLKADSGLLYENYIQHKGIAHFRISQGMRVSCNSTEDGLILRRYSTEPEVNGQP
jgi:hypothetical protein